MILGKPWIVLLLFQCFWLISSCGGEKQDFEPQPVRSGGSTSVANRTSLAFTFPAANLDQLDFDRHLAGDPVFEARFVSAPATLNAGLGPQFNNVSCTSCHIKNGRGLPIIGDGASLSQMLVRVSLDQPDAEGYQAVPGFGMQIQDHAITGALPEAKVELNWEEIEGFYPDGNPYRLRKPLFTITSSQAMTSGSSYQTSLRATPPVFGLGLLEAINAETILAREDLEDRDGDGISGKANWVWNPQSQRKELGRFGWKANTVNLLIQTAAAFHEDMGITNPIFFEPGQSLEIDEETLKLATFYSQTLAVPDQAVLTVEAQDGQAIFRQIGCESCHREQLQTGDHEISALRHQWIKPYTDLLLHDMGEGLADGRPDHSADGQEWRTAPLWGIGLAQTVLPGSAFLHDGRARTIEEAILWHGGEAQKSRDQFMNLPRNRRENLIQFLHSL